MSSKIMRPGDPRGVSPMSLRQVSRSGEEAAPGDAESQKRFALQVAQLEQQHQQALRDAHAAGMLEGEAAGKNRAAAELHPVMERLSRTIEELSQLRARLRKDAEADLVKLSLAIARRVLRRELAVDLEALHGLVMAALEKLQGQEAARVRVHPSQAASIGACLSKT